MKALPAGGQVGLVLHFIDATSQGMIGDQKKQTPHYGPIRAPGLTQGAWKFGGLVHIPSADTGTTRKAAQEICHELWVAYEHASRALSAEPKLACVARRHACTAMSARRARWGGGTTRTGRAAQPGRT